MYNKVKGIIQKVTRATAYAGMVLLVPMMLLTSLDVVTSKFWANPIPGSMELSSFMLSVFILLGVAYTHQVRGHVRVTMFTDRLPEKYSEILNIFTTILTLFIVCIVIWQGIVVAFEAHDVSDMLRIPSLPFRLLVSVAAVLLALELLFDLVDSTRSLIR